MAREDARGRPDAVAGDAGMVRCAHAFPLVPIIGPDPNTKTVQRQQTRTVVTSSATLTLSETDRPGITPGTARRVTIASFVGTVARIVRLLPLRVLQRVLRRARSSSRRSARSAACSPASSPSRPGSSSVRSAPSSSATSATGIGRRPTLLITILHHGRRAPDSSACCRPTRPPDGSARSPSSSCAWCRACRSAASGAAPSCSPPSTRTRSAAGSTRRSPSSVRRSAPS